MKKDPNINRFVIQPGDVTEVQTDRPLFLAKPEWTTYNPDTGRVEPIDGAPDDVVASYKAFYDLQ